MAIDSPEHPSLATEKTIPPAKVVLELDNITLDPEEAERPLLENVSLQIGAGQLVAIVGPSGCGKSTLLKAIAGIEDPDEGRILWHGEDLLTDTDLDPQDLGYVPQFSIAYERLTVDECIENALLLRVAGLDRFQRDDAVDKALADVGLSEIADRQVAILSGGQKRRLALAMELVSHPSLLLCDEVTSGLDPKAEDEIVELLRKLSREEDRIVISVTHSLRHLKLYDSVIVLCEGRVAYHGSADYLLHYFDVTRPEDVFSRLSIREGERWARSWSKHQPTYYLQMFGEISKSEATENSLGHETATSEDEETSRKKKLWQGETRAEARKRRREEREQKEDKGEIESSNSRDEKEKESEEEDERESPGAISQIITLTKRRFTLFFRDPGQMWLQLAMLIGFPCLVVVFALNGLPQIKNLSTGLDINWAQQMKEGAEYLAQSAKVGTLVSGIVMFQVVLLTLMASNNSAREIAGERLIFEKEKLAGLHPFSYLFSKILFLALLVVVQSCWMGLFVHAVCKFPGNLGQQIVFLILVNGAMTSVCLAISSLARTAEQASLLSIYLVGFQLPLSGAVLALPEPLGTIVRPFIASYWSWSGYLKTMKDTRFYDVVQDVAQTVFSPAGMCLAVLVLHVIVSIFLAYFGAARSRWRNA